MPITLVACRVMGVFIKYPCVQMYAKNCITYYRVR